MDDSATAIVIRELRKVYGSKAAVDGLSLSVPRGCFAGFLGPQREPANPPIRMPPG
jgi:ABC-2 type transport system ATP-binding protein